MLAHKARCFESAISQVKQEGTEGAMGIWDCSSLVLRWPMRAVHEGEVCQQHGWIIVLIQQIIPQAAMQPSHL